MVPDRELALAECARKGDLVLRLFVHVRLTPWSICWVRVSRRSACDHPGLRGSVTVTVTVWVTVTVLAGTVTVLPGAVTVVPDTVSVLPGLVTVASAR